MGSLGSKINANDELKEISSKYANWNPGYWVCSAKWTQTARQISNLFSFLLLINQAHSTISFTAEIRFGKWKLLRNSENPGEETISRRREIILH